MSFVVGSRRRVAALLLIVSVGALSGCGGQDSGTAGEPDVPAALTESATPLPSDSPAPVLPAPETGTPTLPPGDPGNSPAPSRAEDPELPPRTDVPDAALFDTITVGAIAGGQWSETTAPAPSCSAPRPAAALVDRTIALKSSNGLVIETVSVYATGEAAEAAVDALTTRLTACGWSTEATVAMGEAAAQLRRGRNGALQRLMIVAVEGVTATIIGSGSAATPERFAGLVDVAVNSSCAAAADGCH